jgi:hypothetical protein
MFLSPIPRAIIGSTKYFKKQVNKMGHPDRRPKRERKKKRQKMLSRRNLYERTLDLTPYNAVGPMVKGEEFTIKYK